MEKQVMHKIYESSERPVWSLSVDEIKGVVRGVVYDAIADIMSIDSGKVLISAPPSSQPQYIYGLAGICKEFSCGHNTAQRLKDTILRDAVLQAGHGCKIVVDRALARRLYADYMLKDVKR